MPTHDVLAPGHSYRPTSESFYLYIICNPILVFQVNEGESYPAYAGNRKLVPVTEAPTSISLGELYFLAISYIESANHYTAQRC